MALEFPDFLYGACISVHCLQTGCGTNRVLVVDYVELGWEIFQVLDSVDYWRPCNYDFNLATFYGVRN